MIILEYMYRRNEDDEWKGCNSAAIEHMKGFMKMKEWKKFEYKVNPSYAGK